MRKQPLLRVRRRRDDESGFTLLEYCAGAAVVLIIVYVALQALGQNMSGLLDSIGQWATRRSNVIATIDP